MTSFRQQYRIIILLRRMMKGNFSEYYFRTERPEVICAMFCGCRCLQRRAKRLESSLLFPNFKLGNNNACLCINDDPDGSASAVAFCFFYVESFFFPNIIIPPLYSIVCNTMSQTSTHEPLSASGLSVPACLWYSSIGHLQIVLPTLSCRYRTRLLYQENGSNNPEN